MRSRRAWTSRLIPPATNDGHVIDPAVPVRVLGQPEGVPVGRVLQRPPVGAASRHLPRCLRNPAVRSLVAVPAELRKRRPAHQFADLDGVLDAGQGPAGQEEARDRGQRASGPGRAAACRAGDNTRRGFRGARIDDLAGGRRAAPAAVLVVGRVEGERVDEPLGQRVRLPSLAPERLVELLLDRTVGGRSSGRGQRI